MTQHLHISLLGGLKLVLGDAPITTVNTPRLQALLAYLLIHRAAPQPRQHIAFLFWPDSPEAQAQSNLRNLLLALRRTLPNFEDYVLVERQTLQWRNDSLFTLDVAAFERATAEAELVVSRQSSVASIKHSALSAQCSAFTKAVDLYAGDALPACYDEWILASRERLREGFLRALTGLASALESAGELSSAILYAQRLLRYDPLQEENYRCLMQLHLANGDFAGVVVVYRQCERVLHQELGVEPSNTTRQLRQRAEELARPDAQRSNVQTSRRTQAGGEFKRSNVTRTPNNLPAQTSAFIGREREAVEASQLLRRPDCRLVTLTGVGGAGKTRLALQVASGLDMSQAGISDGVYFVPLAALTEPNMVERAIAQALDVTESGPRTLRDCLLDFLRQRRVLLVLDNFEHLTPAASLVSELLAACPHLKALITSRAALNLTGEHEYVVPPMTVPSRDMPPQPDDLMQYEAVALFVERALEASPQFALTRENARSIADVCRRLEGLPLAIELAAARVKVLTPEAILSRLDRRLKLLVGGKSDLPPRQRALETAIAWSYNLLNEPEKALFRGLSVFAGGCSLQAVEEVIGSRESGVGNQDLPTLNSQPLTPDVLDNVSSLINKSLLVRVGEQGGEPRFAMLETLREYGSERLDEHGDLEALSRRHALYFMEFAETSMLELKGSDQLTWIGKINEEYDNLRAAMRWAVAKDEAETALRLAGALGTYWDMRGYLGEGRSWLSTVLDLAGSREWGVGSRLMFAPSPYSLLPTPYSLQYRARALYSCGLLAVRQRDYAAARRLLEESRGLYKELGDKVGLSNALNTIAVLTLDDDYEQAIALHEENLALRREMGNKTDVATTLYNIAFIKMHQGKWDEAYALGTEVYPMWRELDNASGEARTLYLLGMIAVGQEDYQKGQAHLEQCLELCRQLRDDWLTAWALHGLGDLLYLLQVYTRANETFSATAELFTDLGDDLGVARTLTSLGREAFRIGNYPEAIRLFSDALALGRKLDNTIIIGCCMAGFAALVGTKGQLRLSAFLFGCASDLLVTVSTTLERYAMSLNMAAVHAALDVEDPQAWEAAWAEGANTHWEQAVSRALDEGVL